jgi:PPOX class probable F420-dependent enzyme
MLDFTTDFGQRAAQKLATQEAIWLTAVATDGTPQPNPVWFIWENDSFLIFTLANSHKVRYLKQNPKVALNFDGGEFTEDVVVFTGEADFNITVSPESKAAYLEKYRAGIARIGMTEESFFESYSVPFRVKPQKLRGF